MQQSFSLCSLGRVMQFSERGGSQIFNVASVERRSGYVYDVAYSLPMQMTTPGCASIKTEQNQKSVRGDWILHYG
jgi:hypothetical protein